MLLRGKALLTLFFSVLVFCADAYADSKTTADDDIIVLDSVIVSADKRESYAQEAPTAVTVMTGSELEKAGITNIQELLNIIPNTYTSSLVGSISYTTIRGKGTNGFIENSPVIIYVDGIPMDYYQNADPGLEDIERVEVLRGSQGTLYGKGSVGGVINIISKKPADHFEGRINIYVGNYSSYGAHMSVSTPVVVISSSSLSIIR
ncbi:TonB-dependent receptor plug domain-containing protein [Geovibrio ferrireducens]|uniref:TonB-dependent receptor plug domain-containing protein n=1 Tax=Geovibrio ferrireducens TaxID=46201 RepID=UPI0022460C83|nr:TonB-dependent receptor plug domain-containing protein [Geovibrio ferrireducens]